MALPAPVILAVDGDPEVLAAVERELLDRYARNYGVLCVGSAAEARGRLEIEAADEPLALVLAGKELVDAAGGPFLVEIGQAHPQAKRALLIGWGEWGYPASGDAILEAIQHGRIDHYVVRPMTPPDELFHQAVSTFLLEWAEERRTVPYAIHVVGDSWTGAAELRVLEACAFPHRFCAGRLRRGAGAARRRGPGRRPSGRDPPRRDDADQSERRRARAGHRHPGRARGPRCRRLIVGAGPAGSPRRSTAPREGFRTLVVDTGGIGGQARSSS